MTNVVVHLNEYTIDSNTARNQIREYHELMMADHMRGLHPYGRMRRDCPLCVQIDKTLGEG